MRVATFFWRMSKAKLHLHLRSIWNFQTQYLNNNGNSNHNNNNLKSSLSSRMSKGSHNRSKSKLQSTITHVASEYTLKLES